MEMEDLVDSRDLNLVCLDPRISNFVSVRGRVVLIGHVLTRIVQKGADAFGTLREYDRELEVLEALLTQRHWRRGRRGKWYERRALVLTRYGDRSPETLMRAMRGLIDSLNDQDTHLGERARLRLGSELPINHRAQFTVQRYRVDLQHWRKRWASVQTSDIKRIRSLSLKTCA
jgi:hypothetical protein